MSFGDLLTPLRAGMPVHLTLGNHDHREHFWQSFKEEKEATRPLPDRQMALLRAQNVNWVHPDSLQRLCRAQACSTRTASLAGQSAGRESKTPALIVIHPTRPQRRQPGIEGYFSLFEVIRPRTQVKAYLWAHPPWKVEPDTSGIHLINLPPVSHVFREGEPSGWVHALSRRLMQLELSASTLPQPTDKVKLQWRS
jgi:hypothetical protein